MTHLFSPPPLCKCDRLESTIIKLTDFYTESFAFNLLSHLDFLLFSQPPQMACPFQHCSCLVLSFLSEQADYPHLAAIPKKNNNRWAFIQKYFNTVQDLIIILQDRSWGLQHISFVKTTNVFSPKIANLHLLQEICIKIDNRSNTLSTFLEQITLFRQGVWLRPTFTWHFGSTRHDKGRHDWYYLLFLSSKCSCVCSKYDSATKVNIHDKFVKTSIL